MYNKFIKRALDIILSLFAITVLSPLFLVIVVAIKIDSKGPVFFKQKRVGAGKKIFSILKFRTMCDDTPHDVPTHLLQDPDVYITKVGNFLRKTSLDELPQLFNIIKGDMSIVGPRPALYNQYDLIEFRDKYGANGIRPGLTGWAQINGRDAIDIDIKAQLDGDYAKRVSFIIDCKCVFLTVPSVLKGSDIIEGAVDEVNKDNNEKEVTTV